MRVGVAATGDTLATEVAGRFGRCPYFLIVDTDTMNCEAFANPAANMSGGAGPTAVQALVDRDVQVVLAGEFGPKAQQALDLAGIRRVRAGGPVRDALAGL